MNTRSIVSVVTLSLFGVSGCAAETDDDLDESIGSSSAEITKGLAFTVMSYNVRHPTESDLPSDTVPQGYTWNDRKSSVYKMIRILSSDIVALQEAEDEVGLGTALKDLKREFKDQYDISTDDSEGRGNFIMFKRSRFAQRGADRTIKLKAAGDSFQDPKTQKLKNCGAKNAVLVHIEDKKTGQKYLVANTHLHYAPGFGGGCRATRQKQALELAQAVASERLKGEQEIVMGDMNSDPGVQAWAGEQTVVNLLTKGRALIDAGSATCPAPTLVGCSTYNTSWYAPATRLAPNTASRIDYILHGPGLKSSGHRVIQSPVGQKSPSDHFPVVVTLSEG